MTALAPDTSVGALSRAEKLRLAEEALASLRQAEAIDIGTDVWSFDVPGWLDSFVTTADDGVGIWKKMKIEAMLRFGKRIIAEGEQRGGDTTLSKVTPKVTLPDAARMKRRRARRLAEHEPAVREYMKQPRATLKGALRLAGSKADTWQAGSKPKGHTVLPQRQFATGQVKSRRRAEHILAALDGVADGTHRGDTALERAIRHHVPLQIESFLQAVRLIPWLTISRDAAGTTFTIDTELRDICEGRMPRPELGVPVGAFLRSLRVEIARRRKENHDERMKHRWNPDDTLKLEQRKLLDWIESELAKVVI